MTQNQFQLNFYNYGQFNVRPWNQSFFSETGLKNSREIPTKSAVFFHEFVPENPAKFDFFSRDLPEALNKLDYYYI